MVAAMVFGGLRRCESLARGWRLHESGTSGVHRRGQGRAPTADTRLAAVLHAVSADYLEVERAAGVATGVRGVEGAAPRVGR